MPCGCSRGENNFITTRTRSSGACARSQAAAATVSSVGVSPRSLDLAHPPLGLRFGWLRGDVDPPPILAIADVPVRLVLRPSRD